MNWTFYLNINNSYKLVKTSYQQHQKTRKDVVANPCLVSFAPPLFDSTIPCTPYHFPRTTQIKPSLLLLYKVFIQTPLFLYMEIILPQHIFALVIIFFLKTMLSIFYYANLSKILLNEFKLRGFFTQN